MKDKKYAVYVPSKDKYNNKLGHKQLVRLVENDFLAIFGGCTMQKSIGSWRNSKGDIIREKVTIISAFTTPDKKTAGVIRVIARALKAAANQECVSVEINGHLEFIY